MYLKPASGSFSGLFGSCPFGSEQDDVRCDSRAQDEDTSVAAALSELGQCVLRPSLRAPCVLVEQQPILEPKRLPYRGNLLAGDMPSVVVFGRETGIRVEKDEFRPAKLAHVLDEPLPVLASATVREWPVDNGDLKPRCVGKPLNLMEIAEVLPDGERQWACSAIGLEYGRRACLKVGHLKDSTDLTPSCDVEQSTPLQEITVVAVPRLSQNPPLAAA